MDLLSLTDEWIAIIESDPLSERLLQGMTSVVCMSRLSIILESFPDAGTLVGCSWPGT